MEDNIYTYRGWEYEDCDQYYSMFVDDEMLYFDTEEGVKQYIDEQMDAEREVII